MAWISINCVEHQQVFWKKNYQQKCCKPGLKGTDEGNKNDSESRAMSAKDRASQPRKSNGFFSAGFGLSWNLWPIFSFLFFPFGMGVSILCLSYHCFLEVDKLFHMFTDGEFCLRMDHTQNFTHD